MSTTSDESPNRRTKGKTLFFGAVCLVAALTMWIGFHGETHLVCDRTEAHCVLKKTGTLKSEEGIVSLDQIEEARLTSKNTPLNPNTVYDAMLVTEEGAASVSQVSSSSESETQAVVDRINDFLDDPSQQRIEIHDDGGQVFQAMPLVFLGFGVLLLLLGAQKKG